MKEQPGNIFSQYRQALSLRDLQDAVRQYQAHGVALAESATKIRLAVTGNYSTQFLAGAFPLALSARDIHAEIYESGYNQWQLELINASSPLYAFAPTHILILLTSIDLAYSSGRSAEDAVASVVAAVEAGLQFSKAHVLLTLPEALVDELSDQTGAYVWRAAVNKGLRERLISERVSLIDMEPLMRSVGVERWFDNRFYDMAKLPFHPDLTSRVLAQLTDAVSGVVRIGCKLIIVDLDDTLWGGRVGDDGWEGIDIDPTGSGRHFLRLQSFLKDAHAKGILLAIASKNNREPVMEVFQKRKEMIICFDDFVASEIHWEPKSVSVARILDQLNLSTAGVVFLDDNPAEREEVGRQFSELIIPELPEDPAGRVPLLVSTGLFDRRVVTQESLHRHQMYAENQKREFALQQAGSIEDFLGQLDMVMEVSSPEKARDRTLELIQKTNQFNLTTRRYNWDDLTEIMRDGFVTCYRLKDKFGDNGIISVVAVVKDADSAKIVLWLMSCRVLGRKVEEAILFDVAERARSKGLRRLVGEYRPTIKNSIVSNLYPRLGFDEMSRTLDCVLYELNISDANATKDVSCIRKTEKMTG